MTTAIEMLPRLRQLYRDWGESKGGDIDPWIALLADDVRIRSLSDGAPGIEFTRHGEGKETALRYLAGLHEDWEMIYFVADEFVAQHDRVVMLGRCAFRHRRTGKQFETAKADVHTIRDGKICEFQEFYDTARMVAASQMG